MMTNNERQDRGERRCGDRACAHARVRACVRAYLSVRSRARARARVSTFVFVRAACEHLCEYI